MNNNKKLKICFILPVLGSSNSILYAISELNKDFDIIVLTSKSMGTKGLERLKSYEIINNVIIHRIVNNFSSSKEFLLKYYSEIDPILHSFNPNIVFFGTPYLFKIAKKISIEYSTKIVFFSEFFINSTRFLGRRRYYLGVNFFAPIVGEIIRKYFIKNVDLIIVSNFSEEEKIKKRYPQEHIYTLPWCNHIPDTELSINKYPNRKNQIIFAGSLIKITINKYFISAVEKILNSDIVEQVVIIGYGPLRKKLEKISKKHYGRIKILGSQERSVTLREIKNSRLALLTTNTGGWGFIGECFALGTPILYRFNHYNFNPNYDSIFFDPKNDDCIINLNEILSSTEKYEKIQLNMRERYMRNHTSNVIANSLKQHFFNITEERV